MKDNILLFIHHYFCATLLNAKSDIPALIFLIDSGRLVEYIFNNPSLKTGLFKNLVLVDNTLLMQYFLDNLLILPKFLKIFLYINIILVKTIFITVTPITFWALPSLAFLIIGLLIFFSIKLNFAVAQLW
jgi:hypothetical protein